MEASPDDRLGAQSRHSSPEGPLIAGKQTCEVGLKESDFDPELTSGHGVRRYELRRQPGISALLQRPDHNGVGAVRDFTLRLWSASALECD